MAIDALTEADNSRLEKYARLRIRGLGRKSSGRDYEDLLREAVADTFAKDRAWNKSVRFVQHLIGAMRSISSHWKENFDRGEGKLGIPVSSTDSGNGGSDPLLTIPSSAPGCDRVLSAKQQLAEIEQLFRDDSLVREIIGGLRSEMTGPEIQEALNISGTEFNTAVRRIRRTLHSAASRSSGRIRK